jgi:DNA-binding beta-propeller fold protein YncE
VFTAAERKGSLFVWLVLLAACAPAAPPAALNPVAAIRVGDNAGIPAFGFGSVWVPNSSDSTVSRVDLQTNRVVATIQVGDYATYHAAGCDKYGSVHSYMVTNWTLRQCDQPTGIATGGGTVWVTRNQDRSLVTIDPATNRIGPAIPLPVAPWQLASDGRYLWVSSIADSAVAIVDEASRQVVEVLRDLPQGSTGIAFFRGSAWVVGSYGDALTRIDLGSHRVTATVPLPCATTCYSPLKPLAIAIAFGCVWVRNEGNATVARVDPATLAVSSFRIDSFWGRDGLDSIAGFHGSLWAGGLRLQQLDATGRVLRRYPWTASVVSAGAGSLWFTGDDGRVVRARI